MNFLKNLQLSFPAVKKRMFRLETVPLAPSQTIHLIRVDSLEFLIVAGGGGSAIVPLHAVSLEKAKATTAESV